MANQYLIHKNTFILSLLAKFEVFDVFVLSSADFCKSGEPRNAACPKLQIYFFEIETSA